MIQRSFGPPGSRPSSTSSAAPTTRTSAEARAAQRLETALLGVLVLFGALLGGFLIVRIVQAARGTQIVELPAGQEPTDLPLEQVDEARIERRIRWLAAPERGGRDTPSPGLTAAEDYVRDAFEDLGLVGPASGEPGFHTYEASHVWFGSLALSEPDRARCSLTGGDRTFALGADFVPLASGAYAGEAQGPLVFAGYGIDNAEEGYDDFAVAAVDGAIAVVLAGEPQYGEAFKGADVTAEASLWNKVHALEGHGARGVLVVRGAGDAPLAYRVGRATWVPPSFDKVRGSLPTLEVSRATAEALLRVSVDDLEAAIQRRRGPLGRRELQLLGASQESTRMSLSAATLTRPQTLRNVVARLEGRGAGTIILGAHLDHVGVGPRGRIGHGADDNASGVAALLEVAALFARRAREGNPPGATLLFCCFSGEEDGLLGSRALALDLGAWSLPAPTLAMINLDMIGRGDRDEVIVLRDAPRRPGVQRLDEAIARASAAAGHGLARIRRVDDTSFFSRSDQWSFFEVGIPSLFLFEAWPHVPGDVYHTWRDTPDRVDITKVARSARFAALLVQALD